MTTGRLRPFWKKASVTIPKPNLPKVELPKTKSLQPDPPKLPSAPSKVKIDLDAQIPKMPTQDITGGNPPFKATLKSNDPYQKN